jgi:hypothetical protein
VGFLDRAKKLAEQAKEMAEQARDAAEGALSDARARSSAGGGGGSRSEAEMRDPRWGTPYREGMLGRPGWRERGLTDPAAVLPIADRDRAGVPHTTKSEIVEEPFGMGRRWTAGGSSVGLFYQLYPEHHGWEPPAGRVPIDGIPGAWQATLPDGRAVVFLGDVVFESRGIDDAARSDLVSVVAGQLG